MILSVLLATITVTTNSVTFSAKATGLTTDVPVEFLFAGPDSDRDYESLFLTDDRMPEIVAAFKKAGIPPGKCYDTEKCNLWPTGPVVTFEPAISTLVKVKDGVDYRLPDFIWCGGNGNYDMPAAVLAMYTCGQSLFTLDDSLDQSLAYGRFVARRQWQKGDAINVKVTWNGKTTTDITPDFPADKTVAEAVKVATAIQQIDSREHKVNGYREGQFFYQAFLPKEQWRDRKERLLQPVEVRVSATNVVCTVIDEDWKVEGTDPRLIPHDEPFEKAFDPKKGNTVFFYCPADTRLSRLYELKKRIPPEFINFYVYVD